jgi:hypothetical protein
MRVPANGAPPSTQQRAFAEDHASPVRLGCGANQGLLLSGAVPAAATQTRTQEGDLRRGRVHAHRDLRHVARWHRLKRPRCRSLQPLARGRCTPTCQPDRQARLHLHHRTDTASGSGFYLARRFATDSRRIWASGTEFVWSRQRFAFDKWIPCRLVS